MAAFFFIAAVLVPGTVRADGLSLNTEDDYNFGTQKTANQNGVATKTNFDNFYQLYNLFMNKNIFPNLIFDAGGLFTKSIEGGSGIATSSGTKYNLFTDIRLNTKPFFVTVGYRKNTDVVSSSGSSLTNTDERYSGSFNYKSDPDIPSLSLNYSKDFVYDSTHLLTDINSNNASLSLDYDPSSKVETQYSLQYSDFVNNIAKNESTTLDQTGRITYADRFFNNRASVYADYRISSQNSEFTREGKAGGTVQIQLFPVHGLSGISDLITPNTPAMITLNENPALIDGGLAASAGINLGLASGLVTVPAPPRQEWNIGVDFVTPAQLTSLYVWVDKDVTRVSDLFQWGIYVSNDNATWTKKFTVTVAPADFSTLPLPHFIIHLPSAITSRFVKAVVKPLDSVDQTTIIVRGLNPADFSNINVTELQAFQAKTSPSNGSKITTSLISHTIDLNTRVKLLKNTGLFYDMTLFFTKNNPGTVTAFLSNALSDSQKFGGIFTANERAARQDNYLPAGHETEYQYSASLNATPLATLSDSIIYSGLYNTNVDGTTNIQNSILLYNTAALYSGIAAFLSGGTTFATQSSGRDSNTLQGNAGLTLVPNQKMNVNLNYNIVNTSDSGGGKPSTSNTTYAGAASASYIPVNALYLFASIQLTNFNSTFQTAENYGLNFSPFPDGALQFHFIYNESLGPAAGEKNRIISPSLRWNVRPGAFLDLAYSIQHNSSTAQTSDAKIFSSSFRMAL